MIATHTKATQLESTSASFGTNVTGSLLALYVPVAALAGLLFWSLADRNVYLQDNEGLFVLNFRLPRLEQLAVSTVVGAWVAGVPFGLFWLFHSRAAGLSWLDRFSFLMGIGGAILGWALLYLAGRVG